MPGNPAKPRNVMNYEMCFAVNQVRRSQPAVLLWTATIAAGFICGSSARAQSGAPAQPGTEATIKALMTRGVEAYDVGNYAVALDVFHQAAAMRVVEAMMYLGVMYGSGRGVDVDLNASSAWFHHAADAGNSQAMCNIGLMYFQGMGQSKSYFEAMSWFRRSASFGNAEAMFNIGVLYRDGLGVPVDNAEAMRWFRKGPTPGTASPPTPAHKCVWPIFSHFLPPFSPSDVFSRRARTIGG